EHAGRAPPLREVAEAEASEKGVRRAHALAEARAVRVLVADEFLIADLRFPRAVLDPRDRHVRSRAIVLGIGLLRQFLGHLIEVLHLISVNFDRHRPSLVVFALTLALSQGEGED